MAGKEMAAHPRRGDRPEANRSAPLDPRSMDAWDNKDIASGTIGPKAHDEITVKRRKHFARLLSETFGFGRSTAAV